MLTNSWSQSQYEIEDLRSVLTPALLIYPEIVQRNIETTIGLLHGDPKRWRAHLKTAKLQAVMGMLIQKGVDHFKCATTLELRTACQAGASDVLLANPVSSAAAIRVRQIAQEFSRIRISALVESTHQIEQWKDGKVGVFVDINPGMDRTGIPQEDFGGILRLVREIRKAALEFRGLHYYDGHLPTADLPLRIAEAHRGYSRLLDNVTKLQAEGIVVEEVITSGTPTFPAALAFVGFNGSSFHHRISPGTVVYCDATSLGQLPPDYDYRPAAVVVSRVISHPRKGIITCDAGHKTLSVDAGVPNCVILGHSDFVPQRPTEEHLPIDLPLSAKVPGIGDALYLVPRHVCPTVNNFDHALLVRNGRIQTIERVSARGREEPILKMTAGREASSVE
jgi:D-serine deaminase-like pyridoxal phosphate-dependent protein